MFRPYFRPGSYHYKEIILSRTVKVDLGERSYSVIIEKGSLQETSRHLARLKLPAKAVIISNRKVFGLYGKALCKSLSEGGYSFLKIFVPDGEEAKTLFQAEKIYHTLLAKKFNRHTFIIALGGGIVGDLAGFVASTFLRGIPFVQIPTTLLAMVDSSVGGKVAVNLKEGKNLIGSFYQPKSVLIDPCVLKTLSDREFSCGMAEVLKYGLIMDKPFFNYLCREHQSIRERKLEVLEHVIFHSVKNKALIVMQDETESGIRAILNFGHTFAHSIEKTLNFKVLSHGEAVAVGMYLACLLSVQKGFLSGAEWGRIEPVFSLLSLPKNAPKNCSKDCVLKNLAFDKKMTNQGLNFILIRKTGDVFQSREVLPDELKQLLDQYLLKK